MPFDHFAAVDDDFLFPTEVLDALAEHFGLAELLARLDALESPGVIVMWPKGDSIPAGYLLCDGTAVSRTTYAALFAAIGTSEGVGDGSTTFNLPNLKGKMVVGQDPADGSFDVVGETGGAKTHTVANGNLPGHTHTVSDHVHGMTHDHDGATAGFWHPTADSPLRTSASTGAPLDDTLGYVPFTAAAVGVDTAPFVGNTGGSNLGSYESGNGPTTNSPINHMNPYSVRRYIIKT